MKKADIACVIIEKDGMLLLHKRDYSPSKGKLDFVGGYVEKNESPEKAAVRETREETGYNIALLEKIIDAPYFDRKQKHMHLYVAQIIDGTEKNSSEGQPVWVDIDNLPKEQLAFPHTLDFTLKYLQQHKR